MGQQTHGVHGKENGIRGGIGVDPLDQLVEGHRQPPRLGGRADRGFGRDEPLAQQAIGDIAVETQPACRQPPLVHADRSVAVPDTGKLEQQSRSVKLDDPGPIRFEERMGIGDIDYGKFGQDPPARPWRSGGRRYLWSGSVVEHVHHGMCPVGQIRGGGFQKASYGRHVESPSHRLIVDGKVVVDLWLAHGLVARGTAPRRMIARNPQVKS